MKIRVAFILNFSKNWTGGLNYYKNLLRAISNQADSNIELVLFSGKNIDTTIRDEFAKFGELIESSYFDQHSGLWYLGKVLTKLLRSNMLLDRILKNYKVDVLSHASSFGLTSCKTINWIPDFQYVHLPELFSKADISNRAALSTNICTYSDAIIVSSHDAYADLKNLYHDFLDKSHVLQFVSQPEIASKDIDKEKIFDTYGLKEGFLYLPNQFWKHKNHKLVLEAAKLLKDEGFEFQIICTGLLTDYRHKDYVTGLKETIKSYGLDNFVVFLGLIPYEDVFGLIASSKAVINPSLFEGWSSTVEECRSMGKLMILSDLNVHKEQNKSAIFFDRYSAIALAEGIKKAFVYEKIIEIEDIDARITKFAKKYEDIVLGLMKEV